MEARWLNQDSAGLIVERLGQDTLKILIGWFLDQNGGRGGSCILECAPIFDTVLEQRSLSFVEAGGYNLARDCSIQFESGLLYGTLLLSKEEGESPFPAQLDLYAAIEAMQSYNTIPRLQPDAGDRKAPGEHLERLSELDSRVSVLVRTCYRMVEGLFPEGPVHPQALRFLFFAGLVAAGILIPARPPSAQAQEEDPPLAQGL